jgi:hypothetical protein
MQVSPQVKQRLLQPFRALDRTHLGPEGSSVIARAWALAAAMAGRLRATARPALLFVLPTLLACVALLEVGLRLQGVVPSNSTDGIFEKHRTTYRLRSSSTKLARTPSYACTIHSSSLGLRDAAPGGRAIGGAPYTAFLGDSITFGNGVEYGDSFVGVFAQAAERQGHEVVNLAIGGHHLADQEVLLADFLSAVPRAPARVVVIFTVTFLTLFEADSSELIVKDGYLFDEHHWVLPYLTVKLGDASAAYGFFRDGIRKAQGRASLSSRKDAFGYLRDFSSATPWTSPELVARLESRLSMLDGRIRTTGATPVYVYMPSAPDLGAHESLAAAGVSADGYDFGRFHAILAGHAARSGIRIVDLRPTLERLHATGEPVSFMQDPHYNVAANWVIGQALAAALLEPVLPDLTAAN